MSDAESAINNGSKTFALAGKFFPEEQWKSATQIYHWCRYCDDLIDNNGDEHTMSFLLKETNEVLNGGKISSYGPFNSLGEVVKKYNIPTLYPIELLKGMEMDIQGVKYETIEQLELYCYRVASTVGLMMCYIMGLFDVFALKNAAHLGVAMQLTNIARDVKEDAERGRSYLPEELLKENDEFTAVKILLLKAESYYESGLQGTKNLPFRSAFVISMAALFYREIGLRILRHGPESLLDRTVVPFHVKCFLIVKALLLCLISVPERIIKNKKLIIIDRTWGPL